MEGRLVLKNCSIFRADGRIRSEMAVVVENGLVSRVASNADVPVLPGDWEVACRGRIVMPGLVDCHTHLVGAQLMPVSGAMLLRNARVRFDLQSKIGAALTASDVEVLSAYAMAHALRDGVTMVVEHLYAPRDVAGALAAEARSAEKLGIRLVASHATHSAKSSTPAAEQVDANAAFARQHRAHPLVRGAIGFHSSSTADDELLRRIGRSREELGVGAHYHLAENEDDLTATFALSGKRVVPRLESFGLIGPGVVGSYARTVDRLEADRLAKSRTLVALSPGKNLAAEAGGGGLESVLTQQAMLGLGTAGGGSLWQELQSAFVAAIQVARAGRLLDPDGLMSQLLVSGAAELCSMIFGAPSGNIEPGCIADLVVYDLIPSKENVSGLASHLLMQIGDAPVGWTIVNGRVCVREGQLLGADFLDLAAAAASTLEAVWHRASLTREPPIAA